MSSSDACAGPIDKSSWLHFTGVAGSGMSALALFHAMAGGTAGGMAGGMATGSDRAFDRGEQPALRAQLESAGIVIVPQDGCFLERGPDGGGRSGPRPICTAVIASTAIEGKIPDLLSAREAGIPLLHRSELLARYVAGHRTIAVSGTSGKSTVTAMIFTILRDCGLQPGLLTGGALAELTAAGHVGNAWAPGPRDDSGQAPWLVIEADESDGSLVRYHPWAAVVLNLGLDHKEQQEVLAMFQTFVDNTSGPVITGPDPRLHSLSGHGLTFGLDRGDPSVGTSEQESTLHTRAHSIELGGEGCTFVIGGIRFTLPVPGLFNVENAAAAVAACLQAGLTLEDMVAPLARFGGVARRFQSVGAAGGVEVIDDFAHNPDKIAAALAAARSRLAARPDPAGQTGRILAVFQPHGFGPTRFLRRALVETFVNELRPRDVLWMPEIFFAGGTVQRDISAADLIDEIRAGGREARFAAERGEVAAAVAEAARAGDLVLVMGARDPSLTGFCRDLLGLLDH